LRLRLCLRRLCLRLCGRRPVRLPLRQHEDPPLPTAGLHAYQVSLDGGRARVHLRIEDDRQGLLLVNANRSFHLNPTATLLAWMHLEGFSRSQAANRLRKMFKISSRDAERDVDEMWMQLESLLSPEGACPIHDLAFDVVPPFSQIPSAPYRMDLALTYRCNDNCAHCYNARPRDFRELDTKSWMEILDRLWEIGIPHICFTGGEATLRSDLPELIRHAEELGQITGLLSNGRRLHDPRYVARLTEAGLDHVQITLESAVESTHDRMVAAPGAWRQTVRGIRNALEAGLFVMTNTTLLRANAHEIGETIDALAEMGVPTIGINALIYAGKGATVGTGIPEAALEPILIEVRERTEKHGQRLIWYTPTQYCHFDPVQLELGVKGCTAAAYNMCVEPDGGVIPCQSYYAQLGNMLADSWDSIWNHELARWLRDKRYVPQACHECSVLAECGGGCPLTLTQQLEGSTPQPQLVLPLENASPGGL
jgi:radical SAM protein with 4Fe4S-binding SPASM domain